jgi:hypothetical protein
VYIPPDETLMMRAGALVSSSGINRFVSRNGPRTLVAKVSSMPSTETARSFSSAPALLTSTSSLVVSALKLEANCLTASRSLRSHRFT